MSIFINSLRRLLVLCSLLSGLCTPALAHKASDAYLQLGDGSSASNPANDANQAISFKLSIALRDIDAAIDTLDTDNNRRLEWGEIRQNMPAVQRWVAQGFQATCAEKTLALDWAFESLEERSDGVYVRLATSAVCSRSALSIQYQLLRNIDASHRLLIGGIVRGQALAAVVSPQSQTAAVLLPADQGAATDSKATGLGAWATFAQFFPEGVHHLVTGYDHLAFLLALLLPIMLLPAHRGGAQPVVDGAVHRPGLWFLLRTVTGFTIGHSITLMLASLGWIGSPAWVEPAIAITIGISALLNIYPVRWLRGDALALGFGLVHGLGFSNIMREANVSDSLLVWAVAGFNLGVEAGQLAGVALWCCAHLILVRWQRYEPVVVRGGSWVLLALAVYWTGERLV
jgi:HupE / UreJ protein